jgi:hypothetical protein
MVSGEGKGFQLDRLVKLEELTVLTVSRIIVHCEILNMNIIVLFMVQIAPFISLLMTIAWVLAADLKNSQMLILAIGFLSIVSVTYAVGFIFIIFFPLSVLIPITVLGIILLSALRNERAKTIFSVIAYLLNAVLLAVGISLLQSPGTTWGNTASNLGVFCTVQTLGILQVLTYWVESNLFYGVCKFSVGLGSLALIARYGFQSTMFTFETEQSLQRLSIVISICLMLEGLALIVKKTLRSTAH